MEISADGRLVLFDEQHIQPNGIYIRKLDGSPAVLLGEGKSFDLSPDGQWALATPKFGTSDLVLLPTGAGQARKLTVPGIACQWGSSFRTADAFSWRQRAGPLEPPLHDGPRGRQAARDHAGGVVILNQMQISPDGKSLVAVGPDRRVAVYPTEPGEPRPIPGLTPDDYAQRWTADGRSVYVFNVTRPGVVDLVNVRTGQRTPWKEFHPPDPAGVVQIAPFLMTPDGSTTFTRTAACSTTFTSPPT